jgi:hypothetical protein
VYARIERAQLDCERFVREAVAYRQTSPEPITCETEFVRRHVLIGASKGGSASRSTYPSQTGVFSSQTS